MPTGLNHKLSLPSNGATAAGSRSSSVLARPAAARCRLRRRRARHAGHGEAGGAPAHERSRAVLATAGRRSAAPYLYGGLDRQPLEVVAEDVLKALDGLRPAAVRRDIAGGLKLEPRAILDAAW